MWVDGSFLPETAERARQKLGQIQLEANVEARSYGEIDSCGTYKQHGVDFKVSLPKTDLSDPPGRQVAIQHILPLLTEVGKPNLGNVLLVDSNGQVYRANRHDPAQDTAQVQISGTLASEPVTRKVYVVVYDPLLGSGQTLSQYEHWNNYATITQQTVDFFTQASGGKLNYTVVDTSVLTNGWPQLIDGFSYTESTYLAVLAGTQQPHSPQEVDYNRIVNSAGLDICGRLDRGEIDEVWIYNGPWFGFYESRMVGPDAYYINSGPVTGSHGCNRLLPIMGPSVERTAHEAVHNFTHRTESTMQKVYGSWQENRTDHSWDKFALVKAQSPDYSYSGCGSSHYPPNATSDYDYSNPSPTLSNCQDFDNYPNLSDPLTVAQPVTCSTWNCDDLAYYGYWYGHLPKNPACGPDNVANDWWNYVYNLAFALHPSYACQANMRTISGNAGIGGAILSYLDGSPKTVTADSYGNYFLMVSDQWTGDVTPYKAGGYSFNPTRLQYTSLQSDSFSQNYVAAHDAPDINIKGNGIAIADGDDLPSPTDLTDFGPVLLDQASVSHTFTIYNNGVSNLNLTNSPRVVIGGANPEDFSVSAQPASPVAPSGSTSFTVVFDPSAEGLRSASIAIANNDADKDPYTFSIQGLGGDFPEIDLQGNNTSISNGDLTPSPADDTDFGSLAVPSGTASHTFKILNTGTRDLALSGSPKVDISGPNAGDFSVTQQPSSSVPPAGFTTFTIVFDPSATGLRTALATIASDDPDENPYTFSIQGTGAVAYYVDIATGNNSNSCTTPAAPCRNIQEAVNKASAGNVIHVTSGTYYFSTNGSPNVVIINKNLGLSGGWNTDFTVQEGASTIDGAMVNNGILVISGNVTVDNFIVQNSTSSNSGAIYEVNGDLTLRRSTLRNNRATSNGGGIFLDNGTLTVINSTISGNTAYGSGGGIYASLNSGASVTLQNSTLAYNTASTGGGIKQANGTYHITNTIIANNSGTVSSPDCSGTVASSNFNIYGNITGCTISDGSNNLTVDPQIEASLTGSMLVHRLLSGSPAIDSGTLTGCPSLDQQGLTRPQGGGCDVGSVEFVDSSGPAVLSIERAGADPTSASSVDFTVTFSEPVTGVDLNDFVLTTTGVTGAAMTGVDGSGAVYTVAVNTGSGNGTIRLDVVADPTIADLFGNPLSGGYTGGEAYTVSKEFTLEVVSANGTVTRNPDQALYQDGDVVQLTAAPNAGWIFLNWSGDLTGSDNPALITIHGSSTVTANFAPLLTLSFQSVGAYDGWVLESSENSNVGGTLNKTASTFSVGDDKANKQYAGFLHFDTSGLPDTAVVTSATLEVKRKGLTGTDPFLTHGDLLADIQKPYFGTSAELTLNDFQSTAGQPAAGRFNPVPNLNWYSAALDGAGYPYINLTGTTQFRLRFTLDDNNDRGTDAVQFFSGEAATKDRPRLIIQYYLP